MMSERENSINNREVIIDVVKNITPDVDVYVHREQLTITVPKDKILDVAKELYSNDRTKFNLCVDVTGVDWNRKKDRFQVIYILYSLEHNHRVRLKTTIQESDATSPSLTSVWESANWYERETYDMYGIKFEGHPDMRRFYMPEDYEDPETGEPIYPLRKDFPLAGIPGSLPLPAYPEKYGDIQEN